LLAGIRDELVDTVLTKKNNASLSFGFGVLCLKSTGTIEFRSSYGGGGGTIPEPASAEF